MNRRDRKQRKKKEREERLRRAKHLHGARPDRLSDKNPEPAEPDIREQPADRETSSLQETAVANIFASDDAQCWLNALCADSDSNPIVHALDVAEYVPPQLLLKASVCRELITAAELVAACRGRPSSHLPPKAIEWLVAKDLLVSPGVVSLALAGIQRVCDHSELKEVWRASGQLPNWLRAMADLLERLES